MTKSTIGGTESDYKKWFDLLSRTVEELNNFPPDGDIYAFIAITLKQIVQKNTIILVNSFEKDSNTISLKAFEGLGTYQSDVEKILGFPLNGLAFSVPDQIMPPMLSGECNYIPGGIAELTFGCIPCEICEKIEGLSFFGKTYSSGISWKGRLIGAATFILPPETDLENRDLITFFIRQVAGFLSRREAETQLQKNLADLEKNEDKLRKSEEKYRTLAESAKDIIFIVDRSGKISYVNSAMESSFGISPEDAVGSNIELVFPAPIAEQQKTYLQNIFDTGEPVTVEMGIQTLHGSLWYNTQLVPVFNSYNDIEHVMGIARDITSRKEAEKKLLESEQRFRIATQSTNDIVWDWDIDTGVIRWFGDIDQILGYDPGELPHTLDGWKSIIHPDDCGWVIQKLNYHLDTNKRFDEEYRVLTKKGSTLYWHDQASTVRDATGKPIRMIGAITDTTKSKNAEKALRESETQLRATLESTADGILAVDNKGNVLQFSRRFTDLWQIPLSLIERGDDRELLDFVLDQLVDPDAFLNKVQSLYNSDAVDMDLLFFKDGRTFERYSFPMVMEGSGIGRVWSFRDITARRRAEEALSESEEKYRALFSAESDAIFVIDKDTGIIIDCNDAITQIYGYQKDEVIGRPNTTMSAEIDATRAATKDVKNHIPLRYHRKKDGNVFPVEITANVVVVKGKQVIVAAIRDISDRLKAEKALYESENRYRSFVQKFRGIAYQATADWIPVFFHGDVEEITGYTENDFISGNPRWDQIIYPEDLDEINCRDTDKLVNLPRYYIQREYRIIRRDGQVRWVSDFIQNQSDEKGTLLLSGIITDITEKKAIEEELLKKTAELDGFFSVSLDLLCIANTEGYFLLLNPAWEKVLGYQREELISKPFLEFVHPDDLKLTKDAISALVNKKLVVSFTNRYRCKNGTYRWIEWCSAPVGNIIYAAVRDITERKQAEEALRQANKKLNLLSSITRHDINNQLTVLMAYLEILKNTHFDTVQNTYSGKISTAAERISAMIQFTKEYENIGITAPVWQGIRSLVDTAAKETRLGNVTIKNDLSASMEVFADPLIIKVFYNLMDNAVRYGGKITTIRFAVEELDFNHIIVCEDDGNGIPFAEKEKIFERGFGKNTGLGLALSREILDITGITIHETGELGKGARFEILVPKGMYRLA